MNELSAATLEAIYLAVIGVITLFLMWSGWRQGFARQVMTLLAILSAYLVGWFAGPSLVPYFSFLRYPEPLTRIIAGCVAGFSTFLIVRTLRMLLFKKTSQLDPGFLRSTYGVLGAAMGLAFGGVLLFLSSDFIRLIGTVASTHVQISEQRKKTNEADPNHDRNEAPEEPSELIRGLAKLGSALDEGTTGQFIKRYDPVPTNIYASITKLALMVSNQDALDRFLSYPGIMGLTRHPKLVALQSDPSVAELIKSHSYLRLLRHEKVVALASDPEFAAEVKKVNFDGALDAAVKGMPHSPKPTPPTEGGNSGAPALELSQ